MGESEQGTDRRREAGHMAGAESRETIRSFETIEVVVDMVVDEAADAEADDEVVDARFAESHHAQEIWKLFPHPCHRPEVFVCPSQSSRDLSADAAVF